MNNSATTDTLRITMDSSRNNMTPGDRLRMARLVAGYRKAVDFARAVDVEPVTYRAHESGQNGFDADTARKYARKLKVEAAWLLFGENPADKAVGDLSATIAELESLLADLPEGPRREQVVRQLAEQARHKSLGQAAQGMTAASIRKLPNDVHFVQVRGTVEAGVWREAVEWHEDDWFPIAVAGTQKYAAFPQFALVVRGASMNQVYPEGSIVVCVSFFHLGREPKPGERVIVETRKSEFVEATVKEYVVEGETALLYARSDHPKFKEPIILPTAAQDVEDENQGEEIRITGLVIASIRPEPTT